MTAGTAPAAETEPAIAGAFEAAMAAAGPFERAPRLAVALSGGADSTCLLLLSDDWARRRGGDVVALTVDHGLRAGSATEAAAVAGVCAMRGIRHAILTWNGPKPSRAIQERARAARHALLEAWCRDNAILHLLFGHHADDQAETIAMRAARRSGVFGLAGIAPVTERRHVRLLRPLLSQTRACIQQWLVTQGVAWIEDPSNRDPRFLRGRMRGTAAAPRGAVACAPRVNRMACEAELAAWLGAHATIHPEGWVELERAALPGLSPPMVALVLRASVMTVGGAIHPPRQAALLAASGWLLSAGHGNRDFAGCRLIRNRQTVCILRDPAQPSALRVAAGATTLFWDSRFVLRRAGPENGPCDIRPLSAARTVAGSGASGIAAASLPVPWRLDGGADLSHLLGGRRSAALVSVAGLDVVFRPPRALAGPVFAAQPPAEDRSQPMRRFLAIPAMETATAGERVPP